MNTRNAVAIAADVGDAEWAVYCFGANDAAPWKQVPPDEFAANYEMLLRRGNGARQLLFGPAPVVESGLSGARTNGELAVYSAIAAEVARSCGAVFVSLLAALRPRDLAVDGVHLNDHGYNMLERIVVETIEQHIRRRR